MDSQKDTLLSNIVAVDEEFGEVLQDAGITEDDDIQSLCYEALKELCPGGGKKIVQRSKVWKVIQSSLRCPEVNVPSPSSSSVKSTETTLSNPSMSSSKSSDKSRYTPSHPLKTPDTMQHSANKLVVSHPNYTIYSDSYVLAAASAGEIPTEVRNRLTRGTMHNMTSAAACVPFNRLPTPLEIEEMSKSLIVTYPCLRDSETGHGVLFKQLKRRLSNSQPVKKPQGPCPKKRKSSNKEIAKELRLEAIECCESNENYSTENQPKERESNSLMDIGTTGGNNSDSQEMMERHFKAVQKEMEKSRPNLEVLNFYLNKELSSRRDWLKMVPAEERCEQLLDTYPCFKDHVEIIEEVRRVLEIDTKDRYAFMMSCVERLTQEIDFLLYFGITKGLNPPKTPRISTKIINVMQNLASIFPGKSNSKKKAIQLVHELKDCEDPDSWKSKQLGNVPVMVIDDELAYTIVGKKILFKTQIKNMKEAAVGYLASFYLLDFDYPKRCAIGMNILQHLIFQDYQVSKDITVPFSGMIKAYRKYKAEST